MDLYGVTYKWLWRNSKGEWIKTKNINNRIIVIANNFDEAEQKIKECLARSVKNTGDNKAIITEPISKLVGLDMPESFDDGNDVYLIKKEDENGYLY